MTDDETLETQTATTGETTTTETMTAENETVGTAVASTVSATATVSQVVYVGPRLHFPYPVARLTIFRGSLPAPLAAIVAADEDLAACFVPVADLGAAKARSGDPATSLARSVVAVTAKYLKKEG